MMHRILTTLICLAAVAPAGAAPPPPVPDAVAPGARPLLRTSLEIELEERLHRLEAENDAHAESLEKLHAESDRIEHAYERALQQLEITKLDKSVGVSVRRQRARLPDPDRLERRLRDVTAELAAARLERFRLHEQREGFVEPGEARLLGELDAAHAESIRLLDGIRLEQQRLIERVDDYGTFLDENLLWIANATPIDRTWLGSFGEPVAVVFSPANWIRSVASLARAAGGWPWRTGIVLFVFVAMLAVRPWIRSTLAALAGKVGHVGRDRFAHTLSAFGLSILFALPWPLLFRYSSALLRPAELMTFERAVSRGLWFGSEVFLILGLLRALYLPAGLAESHFAWRSEARRAVSRNLAWLMPVLVVMATVLGMTESSAPGLYRDTVGRLAYAIAMVSLMAFSWRVMRRPARVLRPPAESQAPGLAWRGRYLWYPLSLIVPVVLVGMAARGYYLASLTLAHLIFRSIAVLVLAHLLYLLAVRWMLIAQRRLELNRALERRRQNVEARSSREAAEQAGEIAPEDLDIPEIGLETISEHTRRLVRVTLTVLALVFLWFTWSEVAPAFGVLEQLPLWEYRTTDGEGVHLVAVTLADLLLALIVLLVTFATRRNLPGLLEIAFLQPLAVAPGNRHAVVTIVRYVIVTAGLVTTMVLMGIRWGQIQWLVAALGVGLGFGLKEIVSNFVSGLIILFERPVRVGDTVTIGGTSGVVTRIRIRSTSLTDWDNRELIIPNQNLIIEPLTNWTLADQVTRVRCVVGIAYGSDTEKAHRVMLETVTANPLVLDEPAPTVLFLGFGESSLDFEIRVFVKERIQRMPLTHELHMALERALRENHIEIPFPQRDLHLRSSEPGSAAGEADRDRIGP